MSPLRATTDRHYRQCCWWHWVLPQSMVIAVSGSFLHHHNHYMGYFTPTGKTYRSVSCNTQHLLWSHTALSRLPSEQASLHESQVWKTKVHDIAYTNINTCIQIVMHTIFPKEKLIMFFSHYSFSKQVSEFNKATIKKNTSHISYLQKNKNQQ